MDKPTMESASKVDAAPAITAPEKSLGKGKREAEDDIVEELVSAKKQKVKEKKSEVKTEENVIKMKVEIASKEDTSSSDTEQQNEVKVSAKNGHVGSDIEDESCGLQEDASAAQKIPAVAAKNRDIAASKEKDKTNDDSDSSPEDGTLNEDVAATRKALVSTAEEGPIPPAKGTDVSSEDSHSSSEDETNSDEDIAAKKAPTTLNTEKSTVSTQRKDESNSDVSESNYEPGSHENVAVAKEAPAAPTKKGPVLATKKKDESSSGDESLDEDDVTAKSTLAAVAKNKDESREESESDDETRSLDDEPKIPANLREQTTGPKTLFVGNLSFSVEQEDLEHFFKAAGEIVGIRFAMNSDESFKGFGFVEFASAEAAEKALLELNGKELLRRPVRLDLVRERGLHTPYSTSKDTQLIQKGGRAQGQTIFVRGFNKFDSQEQIRSSLEEHFGSCGEITRVSIPKDQNGGVKGIAYIDFKDSDACNQALELNGSECVGNTLLVEEAKPRGDSRDSAGGGRGRGRSGAISSGRYFGGRSGGWDFGGRSSGRYFGGRSGGWDFGGRSSGQYIGGRSGGWDFGGRSGSRGGGDRASRGWFGGWWQVTRSSR